jgi:RNA polymerase sigma factor (sigma-70 family)
MTTGGTGAVDEAALVARATSGDADALDQVVRIVQDPLYRLALRMTGLRADAEDAAQEILIRVVTRLASWRGEASLTTWAYRIGVNYLVDLRHRSALERRTLTFAAYREELADGLGPEYAGPDAELLADEVRLRCTQALLQCLDREERVVFVLGEVFALPGEEAAWILDTTAAAYRKRLERARRRIRTFMRGNCGLVDPANPCRCSRRITSAQAAGRLRPGSPMLATHPTAGAVRGARTQMEKLHDVAEVLRSHPDYALPRARSEAVLAVLRSGRYPEIS